MTPTLARTPFLDRIAYPCMVRHGLARLEVFDLTVFDADAARGRGWRIRLKAQLADTSTGSPGGTCTTCRFRRFLSEGQASDLRRDKMVRRRLSHYLVRFLGRWLESLCPVPAAPHGTPPSLSPIRAAAPPARGLQIAPSRQEGETTTTSAREPTAAGVAERSDLVEAANEALALRLSLSSWGILPREEATEGVAQNLEITRE